MDCTWNEPGLNPYQGDVAAAVARYGYPLDVQERLAARAKRFDFDFLVEIRRDSVTGYGTDWELADMHYGRRKVCQGSVTRGIWSSTHLERAMAYCEASYCIAVPFVCRNVTRLLPLDPGVLPLPLRPALPVDTYRSHPGEGLGLPLPGPVQPPPFAAPAPKPVHTVPTPGSLWLVLVALAALRYFVRK